MVTTVEVYNNFVKCFLAAGRAIRSKSVPAQSPTHFGLSSTIPGRVCADWQNYRTPTWRAHKQNI